MKTTRIGLLKKENLSRGEALALGEACCDEGAITYFTTPARPFCWDEEMTYDLDVFFPEDHPGTAVFSIENIDPEMRSVVEKKLAETKILEERP